MERLYHVSEEPGIAVFEPRPDRRARAVVWAIGASRLQNYLLPRNCPRVTFHACDATTAPDRARFLGEAEAVVAIEEAWERRCRTKVLHLYELPHEPFDLEDATAAYYTSHSEVRPVIVHRVDDPLGAIRERGVDLRIVPCLWQLREDVASSTLGFSIIRMRNAAPPPPGFRSRFPVPG